MFTSTLLKYVDFVDFHVSHDFCVENSQFPPADQQAPGLWVNRMFSYVGSVQSKLRDCIFLFFLLRSVGNPLKKAQRRRKQRRKRRRRSTKSHRLPRKRSLRSGEESLSRMFSTMMRLVHVYNDQTNDLQNITWFTLFQRNRERIMIPSGRYSKLYRPCRFLLQWANTKKWARDLGR